MALTLVVYLPACQAGFLWNDNAYVTTTPALFDLRGFVRIWTDLGATLQYHPLVNTTFWLERHALWGMNPAGYHLVNVMLHGLAAVVLWRCLLLIDLPLAWLAAAVFALHPMQVESVAWIAERKTVLSALFYLSAAWLYLRTVLVEVTGPRQDYSMPSRAAPSSASRRLMYGSSVALFVAAMLSNAACCTLPAALALVVYAKRSATPHLASSAPARVDHLARITRWEWAPLAVMAIIALVWAALTLWIESPRAGATGAEFTQSGLDRVLIAGRAFWFYPAKILCPANLTFIYPRWQIDRGAIWAYGYPAAAGCVFVALWAWSRRFRLRPLSAILYYAGTMAPVLGFFYVDEFRYSFVADQFQYLGGVGLTALFVAGLARVLQNVRDNWRPALRVLCAGAILIPLGCLTWNRCGVYRTAESLWNDTLSKNPACWMAHNNLGNVLLHEGRAEEAERHFNDAIRLCPRSPEARTSLASLLIGQKRFGDALKQLDAALNSDPKFAVAYYNRAICHEALCNWDEAIEEYRRACNALPKYVAAHYNLGVLYLRAQQLPAAEEQFQAVLDVDPANALAHNNLGAMRARAGRIHEAIAHYRKAVLYAPAYAVARRNLAKALRKNAAIDQAKEYDKRRITRSF